MAAQTGRSSLNLKNDFFGNPRAYSFFQAIRLLRRYMVGDQVENGVAAEETVFHDLLRIRPLLSLSFPGSDVSSVEEVERNDRVYYLLTVTFLGLYGASSPLPTHYTEDLLDEASDDRSVSRDFLDILSSPFYRLFYQCWSKNRWFIKLADEEAADYMERLYSLMGLGVPDFRARLEKPHRLLRYIGLFSQFPRSAMGLRALLSDAMGVSNLEVIPNVIRKVPIPEDQRCQLGLQGTVLGEDAYLGSHIDDRRGKIRVVAGPLDENHYHRMLPGNPNFKEAAALCNLYLLEPLECEIELHLDAEEAQTARLGETKWGALGYDTWLFSGPSLEADGMASFALDNIQIN
jgi:type VI secretion system protein ImpH